MLQTAKINKEIEKWRGIQQIILHKIIKEIQSSNKAQMPEKFSEIIKRMKKISMGSDIVIEIRRLIHPTLSEKNAGEQILKLEKMSELINGEVRRLENFSRNVTHSASKEKGKVNRGLFVTLLAVSSIPAFLSIGRGITGMATGGVTSSTTSDSGFTVIGIYFFMAFAVLIAAIAYTMMLFGNKKKKNDLKKNALQNKSEQNAISTPKDSHPKQGNIRIKSEDLEKCVLAVVGIVGIVAILIMVL
jgi:hypothetical protein